MDNFCIIGELINIHFFLVFFTNNDIINPYVSDESPSI